METYFKIAFLTLLVLLTIAFSYYFYKKNKVTYNNHAENLTSTATYNQKISIHSDFNSVEFPDFTVYRKNISQPKELQILSHKTSSGTILKLDNSNSSFSLDGLTFEITTGRMYQTSTEGREEEIDFFSIEKMN